MYICVPSQNTEDEWQLRKGKAEINILAFH